MVKYVKKKFLSQLKKRVLVACERKGHQIGGLKEEVALGERRNEWMGEPEGSFVPRSTIIIVTFDQGGTLVSFMDH